MDSRGVIYPTGPAPPSSAMTMTNDNDSAANQLRMQSNNLPPRMMVAARPQTSGGPRPVYNSNLSTKPTPMMNPFQSGSKAELHSGTDLTNSDLPG